MNKGAEGIRKVETETDTYYAVEFCNMTDYTGWTFVDDDDSVVRYKTVSDAKERIRVCKAVGQALGVKCKIEYRVVKITETITRELVNEQGE